MGLTLQWLAGFVDGEGCIDLTWTTRNTRNGRKLYYPRLSITNVCLPIMKAIQAQFGGYLTTCGATKLTVRTCYRLSWTNKKALTLLSALVPFLLVKKSQAELVIAGWARKPGSKVKASEEQLEQRVQLQTQLAELKRETYLQ